MGSELLIEWSEITPPRLFSAGCVCTRGCGVPIATEPINGDSNVPGARQRLQEREGVCSTSTRGSPRGDRAQRHRVELLRPDGLSAGRLPWSHGPTCGTWPTTSHDTPWPGCESGSGGLTIAVGSAPQMSLHSSPQSIRYDEGPRITGRRLHPGSRAEDRLVARRHRAT